VCVARILADPMRGVKYRNAYCVGDFRNDPLCLAIVFTVHVVEELLLETLLDPFGPLIERQFLLGGFLKELFSINLKRVINQIHTARTFSYSLCVSL
jgi:hypothetical protein